MMMRSHTIRTSSVVAAFGLVFTVLAIAQIPSNQRDPAQSKKEVTKAAASGRDSERTQKESRYAPTLALLMTAYEGLQTKNEQANPEVVRALRRSFERNPTARAAVDKLHKRYQTLSVVDREKVVGKELAQATGATKLDRTVLDSVLRKHFKRHAVTKASQLPSVIDPDKMKPVIVETPTAQETKKLAADRPQAFRERLTNAEAREARGTNYRVEYTGLYCRQEPLDFMNHCEPAVIFTMIQGDSVWTKVCGPYDNCDSGDSFPERRWLRSATPFNRDLTIVGVLLECDMDNLDELQELIQSVIDICASIESVSPDMVVAAVEDALRWQEDFYGERPDLIGHPQIINFDREYAERHTSHYNWQRFEYDTYLRFRGDMSGPRSQRGDFYLFLDVRRLP